jgi:hypothetical protein
MTQHNFEFKRIDNPLRHRGFLAALFVLSEKTAHSNGAMKTGRSHAPTRFAIRVRTDSCNNYGYIENDCDILRKPCN